MRSLEMIMLFYNIVFIGWIIATKKKKERVLLIGIVISALLLLVHGIAEGMRWQMIPAYVMTVVPVASLVRIRLMKSKEVRVKKSSIVKRIAVIALAVLYSTVAVVLPLILPVYTFNKPTGSYGIGTVTFDWTDQKREETFTPEPGDKRRLMVQVWYPADRNAKGKPSPYVPNADLIAEGYSEALHMPKFVFNNLKYVKTHALENIPVSAHKSSYPVLVFSHGFMAFKNQNTFLFEELVSHGYIVAAIDHTYNSMVSVLSDGKVAHYAPQDLSSIEGMDKTNEIWVKDAEFVVDQLEKLAQNDPDHRFTGRMDLEHLGMIGYSFGGATTTQVLMDDPRIKAAINLDGSLVGQRQVPEEGFKKPYLMLSGEHSRNFKKYVNDPVLVEFIDKLFKRTEHITKGGNYWLTINDLDHNGFSDMYLTSPLWEREAGVKLQQAYSLINSYSLDFFNHYLKQEPFKLLEQNIGVHPTFSLEKG